VQPRAASTTTDQKRGRDHDIGGRIDDRERTVNPCRLLESPSHRNTLRDERGTKMKRVAWIVGVVMLAGLAGCRTAPIHNITSAPLAQPPNAALTMADVSRAIVTAGRKLGWRIEEIAPGEMTATLAIRKHVAVVAITHDTSTFSINYRASTNLAQSGTTIHRNYNHWVENLEKAIRSEIALAAGR
jgi:hypothetical protein